MQINEFLWKRGDEEEIAIRRYHWLRELATRDPKMNYAIKRGQYFSKWKVFVSQRDDQELFNEEDVHRSILSNEIVLETDRPTYEENLSIMKRMGNVVESQGYKPHYYYSGSKSIHCSIYFDWKCLLDADELLQERIRLRYATKEAFCGEFIVYLRKRIQSCFDLLRGQADPLEGSRHLIRCELSRNKFGFKTFLGHKAAELPAFPPIRNEANEIIPLLAPYAESRPHDVNILLKEFLLSKEKNDKANKQRRTEYMLSRWNGESAQIKGCVRFMLSEAFLTTTDGYQRAGFYVANELRQHKEPAAVSLEMAAWNDLIGWRLSKASLDHWTNTSNVYKIGCEQIHDFLESLGFKDVNAICAKHKVNK